MKIQSLSIVLLGLLAACSPERREFAIPGPRTVDEPPPRLGMGSAARFGFESPGAESADQVEKFAYRLPDGWRELRGSRLRPVNLTAPGGLEIWVTELPGNAGGVAANLARWYGQLGLDAPSADAVAALPTAPLLGRDALRLDLTSADGARRFVGLADFGDERSLFVRMTGPAAAVDEQLANFEVFVGSLQERTAAEPAGRSRDTRPVGPQPGAETQSGGDGSVGSAGGFTFEVPAGWQPLPPREMRLAFHDCGDGVQVWVTPLVGDGGGLVPNISRWCGQVGAPLPTTAEIAALPQIEMLGRQATLVDLTGHDGEQGMLGAACLRGSDAVFVKMIGPREAVRAREAGFRSFCASLADGGEKR